MLRIFGRRSSNSSIPNSIIWFLTVNDIFIWGGNFIINIFLGLYFSNKLNADPIIVIGVGTAVYQVIRAATQIPIGMLSDKYKSDRDEILMLVIGNFIMGSSVVSYVFVTEPIHYYIISGMVGLGASLNIVDWRKLFAKNLDKGKEGLDYAVYDTAMSFSVAVLAVAAGSVASMGGEEFSYMIAMTGVIMILSNIWLVLMYTLNRAKFDKI